jgi:hypothetical protein
MVELLTRPPLKSDMGDEGMDANLSKPLAGLGDCGEDIAAGLEIKLEPFDRVQGSDFETSNTCYCQRSILNRIECATYVKRVFAFPCQTSALDTEYQSTERPESSSLGLKRGLRFEPLIFQAPWIRGWDHDRAKLRTGAGALVPRG